MYRPFRQPPPIILGEQRIYKIIIRLVALLRPDSTLTQQFMYIQGRHEQILFWQNIWSLSYQFLLTLVIILFTL